MNIFKNFTSILKSFKSSSIINIVGLTVAMIVFFIVAIQVYYDFTYDNSFKNANEILQYNRFDINTGETATNINFQTPAKIAQSVPEVKRYCMVALWGSDKFDIDNGNTTTETHTIPLTRTTSGFLDIFTPDIITGDTTTLFSAPGRAMISEKTAERIFGNEDPIGKTIRFRYSNNAELIIAAVYKDFSENSSFPNGLYTYLSEYDQSEWSFTSYFLIDKDNQANLQEKLNSKEIIGEEVIKYFEENPDVKMEYRLTTPNELYLNSPGKGGSKRINLTYTLLAIGIITVFIAYVNYVNLSIAMAPARVRSINIHKILGVNKTKLKLTVASESVLFTLIAIILALIAIFYLRTTTLAKEIFAANLSLGQHLPLLITVSLILLIVSFLVGLYTMRYPIYVDESEALKGSFSFKKSVKLRNTLIVFQFATAICLIGVTMFIKQQNDFMLHYDWGIPKENIVYVPIHGIGSKAQPFGEELLRDSRIKDYTTTRDIPGKIGMSWGRSFEGKHIDLRVWSVDERFFDFFDIEIIEGRKPEHMDTLVSQMVVNETFLKEFEFTEDIVGMDFDAFGAGRIQAIAKDINFETLHQRISPLAFGVLTKYQNFNTILIKLSGNDVQGSIDYIESTWKKFTDDPIELHFLDEEMDKQYQNETNMASLIAILGLIIVAIAVMGVYGLILFDTKSKSKEIAIRKINGSTIKEILLLLNRTVLIQLCIAFIIAIPISYFAISKWLENFAYKAPLEWWIFPSAGILVLLVVIITVSGQSWRAAASNPVDSLKTE